MQSIKDCFFKVKSDCFKYISSQETKDQKFKNKENLYALMIDIDKFKIDLKSSQVNEILLDEIKLARLMDMNSMPSLDLQINGTLKVIDIDYLDANYIVKQIIP